MLIFLIAGKEKSFVKLMNPLINSRYPDTEGLREELKRSYPEILRRKDQNNWL